MTAMRLSSARQALAAELSRRAGAPVPLISCRIGRAAVSCHYAELWRYVRQATSWHDRLGYLFMPPDWQPGSANGLGLGSIALRKRWRIPDIDGAPTPII